MLLMCRVSIDIRVYKLACLPACVCWLCASCVCLCALCLFLSIFLSFTLSFTIRLNEMYVNVCECMNVVFRSVSMGYSNILKYTQPHAVEFTIYKYQIQNVNAFVQRKIKLSKKETDLTSHRHKRSSFECVEHIILLHFMSVDTYDVHSLHAQQIRSNQNNNNRLNCERRHHRNGWAVLAVWMVLVARLYFLFWMCEFVWEVSVLVWEFSTTRIIANPFTTTPQPHQHEVVAAAATVSCMCVCALHICNVMCITHGCGLSFMETSSWKIWQHI